MSTTSEPTTQDIKDAFVWVDGYPYEGHVSPELEVLFDSWLAEHDRTVTANALDAAADGIYSVGSVTGFLLPTVRDMLRERAAEIRQSSNALVTDERTKNASDPHQAGRRLPSEDGRSSRHDDSRNG